MLEQSTKENQSLNGRGHRPIRNHRRKSVGMGSKVANHCSNNAKIYFGVVVLALALIWILKTEQNYQKDYHTMEKEFKDISKSTAAGISKSDNGQLNQQLQTKQIKQQQASHTTQPVKDRDIFKPSFEKKVPSQQVKKEEKQPKGEQQESVAKKGEQKKHESHQQKPKKTGGEIVKGKEEENQIAKTFKKRYSSARAKRPIANITLQQRNHAVQLMDLKDLKFDEESPLVLAERSYYQSKYNISSYEEKPFCIVIPTYNNVKNNMHIKNIKSVVMQEYKNYHIVIIDDASTDSTGQDIADFFQKQTKMGSDQYVLVRNKQQKRAMPNLRMAARQYCRPQDIFLIVDGDDQLVGRQVLKLFNAVFQKEGAWFVYTNFLNIKGGVGYSRPFPVATVKNNRYRAYPFVTSHLRAFYTQLFLNIKEPDLKDDKGNYLKAANDVAICIPILEMSHQKVRYVPQMTYFYNSNTGQNNHQVRLKEQKANDRMLRKRKSYKPLESLFSPLDQPAQPAEESMRPPIPQAGRKLQSIKTGLQDQTS